MGMKIINKKDSLDLTCSENRVLLNSGSGNISVYDYKNGEFCLVTKLKIRYSGTPRFINSTNFVVKTTTGDYYMCDTVEGILKKYKRMKGAAAYAQDDQFVLSKDGKYLYDAVRVPDKVAHKIIKLCLSTGEYTALPIEEFSNHICDLYLDESGSLSFRQVGGISPESTKLFCRVYKYNENGGLKKLHDDDDGRNILKLVNGTKMLYNDFSIYDLSTGQRTPAEHIPNELTPPVKKLKTVAGCAGEIFVMNISEEKNSYNLYKYDMSSRTFSAAEVSDIVECAACLEDVTVFGTFFGPTFYLENELFASVN